jgi:hypothetical protein
MLAYIVPFFQQAGIHQEWSFRNAAAKAFACALNGPSPDDLKRLIWLNIATIIGLLNDPVAAVKKSAALTVKHICELVPEAIDHDKFMMPVATALLAGLQMEVGAGLSGLITTSSKVFSNGLLLLADMRGRKHVLGSW